MIIAVAHQKGGTGKSTIALNLAFMLEASILDLDSQASCKLFNMIREKKGGIPYNCFTTENEKDLQELLSQYKKSSNPTLVVDTGGFDSVLNRIALINSDLMITPVAPSQIEIFGLQKFQSILKKASLSIGRNIRTNVLINNADPRSKPSIVRLKSFVEKNSEHLNLLKTVIHFRIDYKKSYEQGMSVIEINKKSKASQEILELKREILSIIVVNN